MEVKLLRIKAVLEKTGMGKTKLYRMVKLGQFPSPVEIVGSRAWRSSEIDQWIESLPKANTFGSFN
jgi:prophage regulatory protein